MLSLRFACIVHRDTAILLLGLRSCFDVKECHVIADVRHACQCTHLSARNTRSLPSTSSLVLRPRTITPRLQLPSFGHHQRSGAYRLMYIDEDPTQTSSVAASTMRYQICPRLCHRLTSAVLQGCGQSLCRSSYGIAAYRRHEQDSRCIQ